MVGGQYICQLCAVNEDRLPCGYCSNTMVGDDAELGRVCIPCDEDMSSASPKRCRKPLCCCYSKINVRTLKVINDDNFVTQRHGKAATSSQCKIYNFYHNSGKYPSTEALLVAQKALKPVQASKSTKKQMMARYGAAIKQRRNAGRGKKRPHGQAPHPAEPQLKRQREEEPAAPRMAVAVRG